MVTDDDEIAEKVRMLRNYGQKEKYNHLFLAYNRRLDTLQAAVLRVKLRHLDDWNEARRKNAYLYNQLLKRTEVITPEEAKYVRHVYHLYVIQVKDRDRLQAWLLERGISTGIHYPIPLHLQKAYLYLRHNRGDFPVTEKLADETLSLPMHPQLTRVQITYIAECVKEFQEA